MEIWKDVPNHSNYEVSNEGRVRNKATGKALSSSGSIKGEGYAGVTLGTGVGTGNGRKSNGLKMKSYKVHRLVMLAFVGPCPEGCNVNHKDGDKRNNSLSNLEYVSYSENTRHAISKGLFNPREKSYY